MRSDTEQMAVENTAFLLERLASDCSPEQYVRELTMNSFQAIQERQKEGWDGEGLVVWDVDWNHLEDTGFYKAEISDNGCGMTGEEMERYINRLASSGRIQDHKANFGLGAKITAGVKNPEGLVYRSWRDGVGNIVVLWKDDEASVYGLRLLAGDEDPKYSAEISEDARPKTGTISDWGTAVTLNGINEAENTVKPVGKKTKWLISYLNNRFFRLPEDVELKVRDFSNSDPEEWPKSPEVDMGPGGSQLRKIAGLQAHFEKAKEVQSGRIELTDASVFWFLLPEGGIKQADIWECRHQVGAVYQNEVYEHLVGKSALVRLREFGVIFGTERAALFVEPKLERLNVMSNTARNALLVDQQELPWDRWAQEFRLNLPQELKDMMDEITTRVSGRDHSTEIKRRLKQIANLFRVSRYRRSAGGSMEVDGFSEGGTPAERGPKKRTGKTGGGSGGRKGDQYGRYLKKGGDAGEETTLGSNFPDVMWVSISNKGRDLDDDLEDRAAVYIKEDNLIKANLDFRGYQDLTRAVREKYSHSDVPDELFEDHVKEWMGQQLVEAVVGIQSLQKSGSKYWAGTSTEKALEPEALTVAAMIRFSTFASINRTLGAKYGSSKASPAVD